MNPGDEIPEQSPTDDEPIKLVVLDYAHPNMNPRRANLDLVVPAGLQFGMAAFVCALPCCMVADQKKLPTDIFALGLSLIIAIYAGVVALGCCLFRVRCTELRLQRRPYASLIGAAIYAGPIFLSIVLNAIGLISDLGRYPTVETFCEAIFIAWLVIFPWGFCWFLLRLTDAAPEAGLPRTNLGLVLPAAAIFIFATLGWMFLAVELLWIARAEMNPHRQWSFTEIPPPAAIVAVCVGILGGCSCFLRALYSSIRLEVRKSACWFGPLIYIGCLFIALFIGRMRLLSPGGGIVVVFLWSFVFPSIFGCFLLRPARESKNPKP